MTVQIEVHCDGYGCSCSKEIDADTDPQIERGGWGIDQNTGFHYCPKCWPVVQKELEEDNEFGVGYGNCNCGQEQCCQCNPW